MARVLFFYPHLDNDGGYPADLREIVDALRRRDPAVRSATTLRTFRRCLTDERPDLVHLIGLYLWQLIPVAIMARSSKIPYVISTLAQESPLLVHRGRRLAKALWIVAYARIVAAHCVGRHTFSSWEDRLGLPTHNLVRTGLPIHPQMGLPLDARLETGRKRAVHDEPVWFQFVGRKDITQKGLDLLIHALAEVAEESDEPVLARIEGIGDIETDDRLRRIAEGCGIASRVEISGPVDALEPDAARFFVYPSRFDGPPRPVRAALAAGMPVIVTEESGMGDAVRRYGAGLVCGASAPQLANALGQAMASSKEYRRTAALGALELAESLAASVIADSLMVWYSDTIRDERERARSPAGFENPTQL